MGTLTTDSPTKITITQHGVKFSVKHPSSFITSDEMAGLLIQCAGSLGYGNSIFEFLHELSREKLS